MCCWYGLDISWQRFQVLAATTRGRQHHNRPPKTDCLFWDPYTVARNVGFLNIVDSFNIRETVVVVVVVEGI